MIFRKSMMRILATFNQEHTERWKLDSYSRRGDRQEGSWRWAFGIKLCIDDTDDKSTACLEATKLSVDDQQEAREEEEMGGLVVTDFTSIYFPKTSQLFM